MSKEQALKSIINEAEAIIRRKEGKYAKGVIADFTDAINQSDNQHKTAYQWLQKYRNKPYRKSAQRQNKTDAPRWTPTLQPMSKFAEIWEMTNLLTGQFGKASTNKKRRIIKQFTTMIDDDTRDHIRAALAAVLRDEQISDVRYDAIWALAEHFTWSEIEWTFYLHHERGLEIYSLIAAEAWCQMDVKNVRTQKKAMKAATQQLISETIGA